jgi:polyphosphate kinase 2 (PPK2 family)
LERTSTGHAPWDIVEAADRRFRHISVASRLATALETAMDNQRPVTGVSQAVPAPRTSAALGTNVIRALDLSQQVEPKTYKNLLAKYQSKLGRLARQLSRSKRAVVAVFEGPDAAGKGGCIRRITQSLDARFYRVVPIAAPTDEERARPYLWRFWRYLPNRGHFSIYDRSWYGRVLVERVEKLCQTEDWQRAFAEIDSFEEQMVESGVIVLKFWLAISAEEQLRRFREREKTGYKRFKITEEDYRNREKWLDYETAACEMFARTSTEAAPWTLVEAEDKHHARIKVLQTFVNRLEDCEE